MDNFLSRPLVQILDHTLAQIDALRHSLDVLRHRLHALLQLHQLLHQRRILALLGLLLHLLFDSPNRCFDMLGPICLG